MDNNSDPRIDFVEAFLYVAGFLAAVWALGTPVAYFFNI